MSDEEESTSVDDDVEYLRFENTPVCHLRESSAESTICGMQLATRRYEVSTEPPVLLDRCKFCHGESEIQTVEDQYTELRSQLSERVQAVSDNVDTPGKLDKEALEALFAELPTTVPDGGSSPAEIRSRLGTVLVDVDITASEPEQFSRAELGAVLAGLDGEGIIPDEQRLFIYTTEGRVACIPSSEITAQHRGGKGRSLLDLSEDEEPHIGTAVNPRSQLYVFTSEGLVHEFPAHKVPATVPNGGPTPLDEYINLSEGEVLQGIVSSQELEEHDSIVLATKSGLVKRTPVADFENIHRGGIRAIELEDGDEIRAAELSRGEDDLLITTQAGRAIRFEESEVRSMGRTARGVRGISLDEDDEVIGANTVPVDVDATVLTATANGFGKRSAVSEFRRQSRNGRGLIDIDTTARNGPVVAASISTGEDDITALSASGNGIRCHAEEVTLMGRNTLGVEIMELNPGDCVVGTIRTIQE